MLRNMLIASTGLCLVAGCGQVAGSQTAEQQRQTPAAPVNYGNAKPVSIKPFKTVPIATFNSPWALAFLPDGTMLVTEKPGHLWLVTPSGTKIAVGGVPTVHFQGQGGLLFVATSPGFAQDRQVYLTYAEPGDGGDGLALARATLGTAAGKPVLQGLQVIWRQLPRGEGGQFGGYVAFSPDGQYLFLTSGERQRFTPAQDPNQALGKILRLTLDGKPAPGNPGAGKTGATTIAVIDPPANTGSAAKAPSRTASLAGPNLTPAETWTTGHRNQYGLAFDVQGRLWETEMGPQGGDELNLIEPGKNYGWPVVSYGKNYDDTPIAHPNSRPEFQQPALYWNPVIAPAGLAFYNDNMFPQWRGSAFVGGLASTSLVRVAFDGTRAREAERWDMGARIRAVMAGPDGGLWLLEDGDNGRLLHLTGNRGG
ncbi:MULTISPECIES: PQQ-dependent sugar dehydrogenase [unclassified Sphingomonas]|uniref:PQQ-dependent sugar dehydrogenase n=1 Tax=unclassified Sphingomonas TaxID=196159 RepID=UPI00226A5C46|nr:MULTISPECIES: PQQ-dependent sugar dehydrogenase [unclassified Sphingomonas]